jgi:CBS domain-containing protein
MRPPLTTVEQAAAYLMKHAGATALLVLDGHTDQPIGIITQADITRAVADGKDVNRVRIYDLMTTHPAVISTTTSVRDAANAAPEVQDVLVASPGWMAQQESRRRSERIKAGLDRRHAQGKPVGRLPGAADKKPRNAAATSHPGRTDDAVPPTRPGQHHTKRAAMTGARKTSQGGPQCRPLLMTSAAPPEPTRSPIPLRASSSGTRIRSSRG